jgi:hypothetical protein
MKYINEYNESTFAYYLIIKFNILKNSREPKRQYRKRKVHKMLYKIDKE